MFLVLTLFQSEYRSAGSAYGVCFMRRMVRRLPLLVLLIAALLAVEPLLHHHPLQTHATNAAAASSCAICATFTGRLPIAAPTVPAPQAIVALVVAPVVITIAVLTFSPRASRAPPAA